MNHSGSYVESDHWEVAREEVWKPARGFFLAVQASDGDGGDRGGSRKGRNQTLSD